MSRGSEPRTRSACSRPTRRVSRPRRCSQPAYRERTASRSPRTASCSGPTRRAERYGRSSSTATARSRARSTATRPSPPIRSASTTSSCSTRTSKASTGSLSTGRGRSSRPRTSATRSLSSTGRVACGSSSVIRLWRNCATKGRSSSRRARYWSVERFASRSPTGTGGTTCRTAAARSVRVIRPSRRFPASTSLSGYRGCRSRSTERGRQAGGKARPAGRHRYDQRLVNQRGTRRFSQAISEGDGISVLVDVADPDAARTAERHGADGVVVRGNVSGLRDATELPVLWCADGPEAADAAGADACLLVAERYGDDWNRLADDYARVLELGLDCVVELRDEEQLEDAFEHIDPEIVLLAGESHDRDADPLDHVLELLPDVPAGKLAVAHVAVTSRDEVIALERAGIDAVIVEANDVSALVGDEPPTV